MLEDRIKQFYKALSVGDTNALVNLFAGEPWVNTPQQGEVKGTKAFKTFVQDQQTWLNDYFVTSGPR